MSIENEIGSLKQKAQLLKGMSFFETQQADGEKYRTGLKAIKDALSVMGNESGEPSVGLNVDVDEKMRITEIGITIKIPF